ncbi:uncharacterized protein LOC116001534 [Ipomoea triloba]|uniref:uncharacterized protein LOC116001534 n=1 Tax=Ipomoea triloba TaxID=35885 RepID=UPI00125DF510|nr:uncharacterized protein LOC116001534 [Ipomoea triloba]
MAASSPALSNPTADSPAAVSTPPTTNASKNLRGLNKPKCIKCGNVARSRCPYQSCKSCCAKAQNPCHIHVLKGQSNLPDKALSSGSPIVDQQSTEASHPGASHRPASFRQLSTNFAQFNNLQTPLRRKPVTRKDAQVINEWRFLKLKEFRDNNIEIENEAFDRYMQNVFLLEEVFGVNSEQDGQTEDGSSSENPKPATEEAVSMEAMVAGFKLQLRSDPVRIENTRKRMQYIVDRGLKKLRKLESDEVTGDLSQPENPETFKSPQAEWTSALGELIDKMNKARNEEDLKACWEMKTELFNRHNKEKQENSEVVEASKDPCVPIPQTGISLKGESNYSPPKWFTTTTIDDEELCQISAQFDSLEDIEDL